MSEGNKVEESRHLLTEASNQLALELYNKLAKEGKNVFFSPISISLAMAMLFRGAKGVTSDELKQVLGYNAVGLEGDDVHKRSQRMLSILNEEKDSYTLSIANSLVHQAGFQMIPDFKSDLEEMYRALVLEVDFEQDSAHAVNKINDWVKTNTRGMIPKVVNSLDPATVVVLLNAVYFKGTWMQQFDPKKTILGNFYNKGDKEATKEVPMMVLSKEFFFVEREDFKAIELPYQGEDIAMLILLPNELDGLSHLQEHLKCDFIVEMRKDLRKVKVDLTLPKLHVEYSKELKDVFRELGLNTAFECGANFQGMSESLLLSVSEIIHKAVLDVNEEGSEAAAVTAIMLQNRCLRLNRKFQADHPFMFFIYDKRSNAILFMGQIIYF